MKPAHASSYECIACTGVKKYDIMGVDSNMLLVAEPLGNYRRAQNEKGLILLFLLLN